MRSKYFVVFTPTFDDEFIYGPFKTEDDAYEYMYADFYRHLKTGFDDYDHFIGKDCAYIKEYADWKLIEKSYGKEEK